MAVRALPRRRARKPAARPRATPRKRRRSLIGRTWWLWAPPIALATAASVALTYVYIRMPVPEAPALEQTTHLFDSNGEFLKSLRAEIDRTIIPLEDVPLHLRQAVIAAEDEDFYSHPGVSVPAIARAAWANFRGNRIEQGASTITMQYVRNTFRSELGYDRKTGFEKTISRKLKEALLAIKLEQKISKNEILERYLNTIFFGNFAYGAEAAAQTYFGVPAKELDVLQSATLAGLIPRPGASNPFSKPDEAIAQRNRVLARMADADFLSLARAKQLMDEPLGLVEKAEPTKRERSISGTAAYFVDYASRYLQQEYEGKTFTGGLRVTTTIDMRMQRLAEQAVEEHLGDKGDPSVALVAIDPRNGEVRAMIGGKDFRKAKCNLATADSSGRNCGTGRQTGSAYKMFTIAAAVHNGISLRSTFSGPGRIVLKDSPECGEWATRGVSNYSDSGSGTMDLFGATARSVNTIFAQLIAEVGPEKVVRISHALGIRSELPAVCSLTLGVAEVSPLEMANSFATIAAGGLRHWATPVQEVKTADGEVLFANDQKGKRVMKANDAWQVAKALRGVVTGGTGTAASLSDVEIVGKTGTSERHANAYFCGSSRILTTCVWVGYPRGNVPMEGVRGINVTGGSFPARIFHSFMAPVHEGREVQGFPEPEITGKTVTGKGVETKTVKKKKKKKKVVIVVVPTTPPPPPPPPLAACSDGLDNDGDGAFDGADPGCTGPDDGDESDLPAPRARDRGGG